MLDNLRQEDFLPLIGRLIEVDLHGIRVQLEVKEAAAINSPSPRATPSFHIVLRSGVDLRLTQGMMRFHHPDLGVLDLFAVPIGPDGKGLCYEIIFN